MISHEIPDIEYDNPIVSNIESSIYFVSHLKKCLETLDGKLRQYAQWCFDNCKCTKVSSRLLPPSSVEVASMGSYLEK
ncbi:hypothetical protein FF38_03278 [Lucilia cuprina]|uniref:Uncharacterized protein n=1 Tax=Lucilia cuprina TaxID=7375 RepID=A0A0L0CK91_LUCCU|nr:hypothetical protein FF38_03278 [Lucilia cuprina]